jgi:multidrug transporter EmrE-like cation transporter
MKDSRAPHRWQLVEVWGDTVDLKHLAWAIVIGIVISLAGYTAASRLLAASVATPELAKAYAMLAGLAGCLISGVRCAVLFKPKREVIEGRSADPAWRQEVLDRLVEQTGPLGSVADLPPAVVKEMKELEIYELFASYRPGGGDAVHAAPETTRNA